MLNATGSSSGAHKVEGESSEKFRTLVFPTRSTARLPCDGIYILTVFDKAEPQLNHRWISLRNALGLPHTITIEAIQQVAEFAEAELGALVLVGARHKTPDFR